MSVSRYPVVDAVAQPGWQQFPDGQEAPCTTQVVRSAKSGRRADRYYFLVTFRGRIYPDYRVNALELRVPAPDLRSDCTLERSETQSVLPLVPEYESHARRTEPTFPVIEQQGASEVRVGLPSPPPATLVFRVPDRSRVQDLTSSTRRLFARPSAVLLSADALVSP